MFQQPAPLAAAIDASRTLAFVQARIILRLMLRHALATSVLTVLLGFATVSIWISAFIYKPSQLSNPAPSAWSLPTARSIVFRSGASDRLFGWWLPPPTATAPVVLVVHGRSANISTRAPVAARLLADGFGVLLFDFRGYGQSTGHSTERSLSQDADAAYDWIRQQGIEPHRIVVLGQSLGNAPAAQLSASRSVGALALVSPFTSLPDAMADRFPWAPLRLIPWPENRFEVQASVRRLHVPVLLIVSQDDGLVPYANSKRLAASTLHPHWLEMNGPPHDGLLAAVSRTGRLSQALKALLLLAA